MFLGGVAYFSVRAARGIVLPAGVQTLSVNFSPVYIIDFATAGPV